MWVVITTSIVAVILTILSQKWNHKRLFLFAFFLITVVQCVAFYGTDYPGYYESYLLQYNDTPWGDIFNISKTFEPGWLILNKLFPKPYGFFFLTALIHLFHNYVFYKLFIKNVPSKWLWFAMFIYLFSPNLYLVYFSALRQCLAVTLCLCSVLYLDKKRLLTVIFLFLLAISVHRSAIFFLLAFAVKILPIKYASIYGVVFAIITIVLFVLREGVADIYSFIMSFETFEKYEYYYTVNQNTSYGLGFLMNLIPYIVIIIFIINRRFLNYSHEVQFYSFLSFLHIIIIPFSDFSIQINRLGYYVYPFAAIIIPYSYSKIRNMEIKLVLVSIFIIMTLVRYSAWFTTPPWEEGYATFKSFFSIVFNY